MSLTSKIAKNTTYLSLSSLFQKILSFGFYIYLANQLGEVLLGRYNFALNYTTIFVIVMNFGLVPVLTREGAKFKEKIEELFGFILSVKLILAVITLPLMFGIFHALNLSKEMPIETIQLVYLAGIVVLLDTFRSVFLAVLRAKQEMHYEAIGQALYQVVVVAGGAAVLMSGFKTRAMVLVIMAASLVYFCYSVYVVVAKAKIRPHLRWTAGQLIPLLKVAAPFALADIFFKLNGSIDTVMLEYLAGDRYIAWYNIASKLTITLTIIPGAFATAFFPAMSKAFVESKDVLKQIFEQTTQYLIIVAIPISFGAYLLAPQIINIAFPDFPAAIPALQIFMAGLLFLFINYPIGNLLNAANKQKMNTINMGIALIVNIVLNIILIPQHTYLGASIAAVVSVVVLVGLGLPRAYQIIQFNVLDLLERLAKAVLAATAMAVALYAFAPYSGVLTLMAIGITSYSVVLFLVRGITIAECRLLFQSVLSKRKA